MSTSNSVNRLWLVVWPLWWDSHNNHNLRGSYVNRVGGEFRDTVKTGAYAFWKCKLVELLYSCIGLVWVRCTLFFSFRIFPCRQDSAALQVPFLSTSSAHRQVCTSFAHFPHLNVAFKCPDWQEVEKKHLKMKCNIGMKRGTRSKMMCKIRAHFPPIWVFYAL